MNLTDEIRPNCSTFNPCGKNGDCYDTEGQWTCSCKFWWEEPTCKTMSNSGQQVIVLGALVGVLLLISYGLSIRRSIQNKRKRHKIQKAKSSTINRTFPSVNIDNYHPARRRLAWVTAILTVLLTISTLIVKWRLLQPIHDEIIAKRSRGQSLFFTSHSICQTIDLVPQFNVLTFPIACFILLLFSLITKRMSRRRHRCMRDRIGIPIPLDFFAHAKRTLVAVVFALFADELLLIVQNTFSPDGSLRGDGIIVKYLIQILKGFAIAIRRYPILAAVYINTHFSLICASLYVWFDFSLAIIYSSSCRPNFYPPDRRMNLSSDIALLLNYYGTGSKLLVFQLLTDIPRYLCLSYVSVKLPMLLYKQIRRKKSNEKRLTREQQNLLYSSLPYSYESIYVKRLLNMHQPNLPGTHLANILRRIYTWQDDFRFSSRVTSVYASIFFMLFYLTVKITIKFPPQLQRIQESLQAAIDTVLFGILPAVSNFVDLKDTPSNFPLPDLRRAFLFGVFIALTIMIIQLLVMLTNIRRNILQTYRGDSSEIPRRSPALYVNFITGNFHFAGYLVGYVFLGYIMLTVVVMILAICVDAYITHGRVRALELLLKALIPILLFPAFKQYLNKILGKYVFLQRAGEVMFIDNRRGFMVFLYLNFFLDAFLGFVTAVFRLLKSLLGAVVYMSRLDYSPFGRKLETFDAGFKAYYGFIHMECAHRHPVLLCFISHLYRDHLESKTKTKKKISRAKRKWVLAVFLILNPELVYLRKDFIRRMKLSKSANVYVCQQERF